VCADDQVALGQGLEVGSDGDFRLAKLLAQLGHRGATGLVDPVEDPLAPFFEENISDSFSHSAVTSLCVMLTIVFILL